MEIVDTDGNKKIDFDEFKSFVETADMNPKSVAVARCDADVMCCAFGGEIDSSDEAPAVVLTASVDALLDEGVEYASKLEAAGNEVRPSEPGGCIVFCSDSNSNMLTHPSRG